MAAGGLWIVLSGALRQYRGVNETISSLLLVYIGLAILNPSDDLAKVIAMADQAMYARKAKRHGIMVPSGR